MENQETVQFSKTRQAIALLGWLALTFCAAATGAFVSTAGWYAELIKPSIAGALLFVDGFRGRPELHDLAVECGGVIT